MNEEIKKVKINKIMFYNTNGNTKIHSSVTLIYCTLSIVLGLYSKITFSELLLAILSSEASVFSSSEKTLII